MDRRRKTAVSKRKIATQCEQEIHDSIGVDVSTWRRKYDSPPHVVRFIQKGFQLGITCSDICWNPAGEITSMVIEFG